MSLRASHCCWLGPCDVFYLALNWFFYLEQIFPLWNFWTHATNKKQLRKSCKNWWSRLLAAFVRQLAIGRGPLTPLGQLELTWLHFLQEQISPFLHFQTRLECEVGIRDKPGNEHELLLFCLFWVKKTPILVFKSKPNLFKIIFKIDLCKKINHKKQLAYQKSLKMYLRVRI